jgi:hypothetical protein
VPDSLTSASSLHANASLPATPLARDHDRGDRRRDRMRGLGDAGQHAAAPDRDGDGAGRQLLRGGRQTLPLRAREGRRGGATSPDRRFGGNRCAPARPPLGRERRPDAGRRRRRREYGRPRVVSTTLADLFTLLFAANPFSAARASLRRWSSDEFEDGLAHGGQCRSRRRPVDSFFPALLF